MSQFEICGIGRLNHNEMQILRNLRTRRAARIDGHIGANNSALALLDADIIASARVEYHERPDPGSRPWLAAGDDIGDLGRKASLHALKKSRYVQRPISVFAANHYSCFVS